VFLVTVLWSAVVTPLGAQQIEIKHTPLEELVSRAEAGDAESEFELGNRYYSGKGVTRDFSEAVKWFRKAAEQNFAKAQYNLGFCYSKGEGLAKDEVEAAKWFRKAAEQNLATAQTKLGFCYENGRGLQKDEAEGAKWYRKAAEQNFSLAQYNLARCYADGRGVPKDESEAVKWFRKAAEQNLANAEWRLGFCYEAGHGVTKNYAEAVKWYRKAAEQNHADAQCRLGLRYARGEGVARDAAEALKWFRKAAEQNYAEAQYLLGLCYVIGAGVAENSAEAGKWFRKAAEQNHAEAQYVLGDRYAEGRGVAKDYVEAYKWLLLAAGQGLESAKKSMAELEDKMTREQTAEGQRLARDFKPRKAPSPASDSSSADIVQSHPEASGSGFFITEDGFLITNHHVIEDGAQVRLLTTAGVISAKVMKVDAANDLALLKTEGKFTALPVATSRPVKLGDTVTTIGFPNVILQGFAPKFSRGEIGSLSGPQDDSRFFQISVPVQPGNSGGALVDERGNVVGVVSAKLSAKAALSATGALPENVNYAVKSSFLLGFLESVPEVAARLKEPNTKNMNFADVVEQAKEAAVLVLVY
jgi:TPR repeat protein